MVNLSDFGKKIAIQSGIGQLMEDLGSALEESRSVLMLGGGNPAHIPEVQKHFRDSILRLLKSEKEFERAIGNYDPPQGNKEFIDAMCTLLRGQLRWDVRPKNIALTNGSQSAFFILFNILAGAFEGQANKKILLPLTPEYIGYCDVGLADDLFLAYKPQIEHVSDHIFKYHVDFDKINVTD